MSDLEKVARAIYKVVWPNSDPDEIVYSPPSMDDPGYPIGAAWQVYGEPAARAALSAARPDEWNAAIEARPLNEWHEDYGPALWFFFPICEPPYCGSPLDDDWPGYHTHWVKLPDASRITPTPKGPAR